MANTKMTKKEYFEVIKSIIYGIDMEPEEMEEIVAFIDHEVELLNKKSVKSGNSAKQQENAALMDEIVKALVEIGKPVTISELQKQSTEMAKYQNQKLSAMLKKLKDNGTVIRTEEKKKAYFSVAETATEEQVTE